jgi:CubicO group peptidase (beta-lactamase class C family)
MTQVHGKVEPGYEKVRDSFARNFEDKGEVGAAFCLYVDGRPVVDVWGGVADPDSGREWSEDTLQLVFSTTKGAAAMCAHVLVDRGELDLDAPVAKYWPEFAAEGKEQVPVRMLLNHQAGLPAVDKKLSQEEVLQVGPIVEALAEQAPFWKPGSQHGYHALTYGWLVGEIVRRVSGRPLGQFLREEIAEPLGLDLWIGLPAEHESRVAPLLNSPPPTDPAQIQQMMAVMGPGTLGGRALSMDGAFLLAGEEENVFNTRAVHAAEMPAANGITTARSLARMYAAAIGEVDGVRLFGDDTLAAARTEQSRGPDACLVVTTRFGLGFMLNDDEIPLLGDGSFGHAGAGGSLAFADPESRVAFGYVMNQMGAGLLIDARAARLIDAVREAL